jgi:endonuclease/exonuclease/phosphatase family metal-dependent hydrolase
MVLASYNVGSPPSEGRRCEFIRRTIGNSGCQVLALQEATPALLEALRIDFPHQVSSPGNDPRQLTLALLSQIPIDRAVSHLGAAVRLSRDLLQAEIAGLSVFVTHLKSMRGGRVAHNQRHREASYIAEVLQGSQNFALCGDLNDHFTSAALQPLAHLYNPHQGQRTFPLPKRAHQFDYILLPHEKFEAARVLPESRASDHALICLKLTGG